MHSFICSVFLFIFFSVIVLVLYCFLFIVVGIIIMIVLSGHVTFDHLHGGIKSGISVLFICLMKSLCDSFLIIKII